MNESLPRTGAVQLSRLVQLGRNVLETRQVDDDGLASSPKTCQDKAPQSEIGVI